MEKWIYFEFSSSPHPPPHQKKKKKTNKSKTMKALRVIIKR